MELVVSSLPLPGDIKLTLRHFTPARDSRAPLGLHVLLPNMGILSKSKPSCSPLSSALMHGSLFGHVEPAFGWP